MSAKVYVTRPLPASERSARALCRAGLDAAAFPTTKLVPLDATEYPVLPCGAEPSELALLILTSANSVRFLAQRLTSEVQADPGSADASAAVQLLAERIRSGDLPIAAVGEQTAVAALDAFGQTPVVVAADSRQSGLSAELLHRNKVAPGDQVLMPCARDVSPLLRERLQAADVRVMTAPLYSSEPDERGVARLLEAIESPAAGDAARPWIVLYAPSQFKALLEGVRAAARDDLLKTLRWAVIGPTTATAVELHLGRPPEAVATRPDDASIAEAIGRAG